MNENQINARLEALQAEREKGTQMLEELQSQQADIHEQLLRIQGAIQVLEELLAGLPESASTTRDLDEKHPESSDSDFMDP